MGGDTFRGANIKHLSIAAKENVIFFDLIFKTYFRTIAEEHAKNLTNACLTFRSKKCKVFFREAKNAVFQTRKLIIFKRRKGKFQSSPAAFAISAGEVCHFRTRKKAS